MVTSWRVLPRRLVLLARQQHTAGSPASSTASQHILWQQYPLWPCERLHSTLLGPGRAQGFPTAGKLPTHWNSTASPDTNSAVACSSEQLRLHRSSSSPAPTAAAAADMAAEGCIATAPTPTHLARQWHHLLNLTARNGSSIGDTRHTYSPSSCASTSTQPASSSCGASSQPPPSSHPSQPLLSSAPAVATAALVTTAAAGCSLDAAMLGGVGQVLAFSMWSGHQRHSWLRQLGGPSYIPTLTAGLIAANVGVFVMQQLDPQIVYHLGEIPYKIQNGEWWRLITPVFLHGGILHLLINSYALYNLGSALEGTLGQGRFATIYFGSAVAGNAMAAVLTSNSYHIGLGSSTALYGMFGAYVVDLLLTRGLRGAFATGEMNNVLVTMGINAAITLSVPSLSIWGHLGGFVGGGTLLYLTRGWRKWRY